MSIETKRLRGAMALAGMAALALACGGEEAPKVVKAAESEAAQGDLLNAPVEPAPGDLVAAADTTEAPAEEIEADTTDEGVDPMAPAPASAATISGPMVSLAPPPPVDLSMLASRKPDADGSVPMTFADLAGWLYQYPDEETLMASAPPAAEGAGSEPAKEVMILKDEKRLPKEILALDKKMINVQGFMIPTDVEEGKIKGFILVKDQMGCCFGVMPMMNEWIHITMAEGKPAEFLPDTPIKVTGELEVGERVEEGMVISLYRMKGDSVVATGKPLTSITNQLNF